MQCRHCIHAREPFAGDQCHQRWEIRRICSAAGGFSHYQGVQCQKADLEYRNVGDKLEYQESASLLLFCEVLVDDLIASGLVRESTPGFVQQQAVFTLWDG